MELLYKCCLLVYISNVTTCKHRKVRMLDSKFRLNLIRWKLTADGVVPSYVYTLQYTFNGKNSVFPAIMSSLLLNVITNTYLNSEFRC